VNRALGAATAGVLLLSPLALSACSAGQVTQTNTQERDKVGAMAQVGDITVRAVELESPRGGGGYEAGDDAEMTLAIVNSGQEADTLVEVDGEGFGDAEIQSSGSPDTGANSGSSTSVGGTTTSGTAGSGSNAGSDEIEIPSDTTVFVDGDEASITLTDLDESLNVGQYIEVTLSFENAGDVTVLVTVANPEDVEERGEAFDFHEEEGGAEGGEDAARERESAGESAGDSGGEDSTSGE
jgi:copper(I)-binding protein